MEKIQNFLNNAIAIFKQDERILAVCAAGSWISKEIDEFSDLDLVIITDSPISKSKETMNQIALSLGNLLISFTGEHVGETRLLICLYENPLLHVDLKFLQPDEFYARIENPIIIWERDQIVTKIYKNTIATWPHPDFQWIEDRFWVWIHYAATKLGRGEYFEAIDFLSFIRNTVIGPLFHLKYKSLPRGVRKIEFILNGSDLAEFKKTVPEYSFFSIKSSLYSIINLYKKLREELFESNIVKLQRTEEICIYYLASAEEEK